MKIKAVMLIALIIALPVTVVASPRSYGQFLKETRAQTEARISRYRAVSDREIVWVLSLQRDDGAVLLYQPHDEEEGNLNPYFACEAMLGVLSDGKLEHINAAGRYLGWHTRALLAEDGRISDYKLENGAWVPEDDGDSFDAYAADYLLLLTRYLELGGDPEAAGDWKRAALLLADRFDEVTRYGVTFVNDGFRIAYLMDNSEVWLALKSFGTLLTQDARFRKDAQLSALGERFLNLSGSIKKAVEERFWMADAQAYTVGIKKDGEIFGAPDFSDFYPDAVAQLYPAIMGVREIGEREQRLYRQICDGHDWEHGGIEGTLQYWTVMAYAAVLHGDLSRLDTYLSTYDDIVKESRHYPLHAASAGWIIRACNKRIDDINAEVGTGLADYLEWMVKGAL